MSISKRLRFEIFRRDNYACVYCGRRAPSVTLEVDHRIPRCNGGSDDPENLVSACWDCNRGKGPIEADGFPAQTLAEWMEEQASQATEWPDELPAWALPRRGPRQHFSKGTNLLAIAAEIPEPDIVTIIRPEAVYRIASAFDPLSEVD
ncbi:MAG: HNH endonuclease [Bryobacteraceae bacterium]